MATGAETAWKTSLAKTGFSVALQFALQVAILLGLRPLPSLPSLCRAGHVPFLPARRSAARQVDSLNT